MNEELLSHGLGGTIIINNNHQLDWKRLLKIINRYNQHPQILLWLKNGKMCGSSMRFPWYGSEGIKFHPPWWNHTHVWLYTLPVGRLTINLRVSEGSEQTKHLEGHAIVHKQWHAPPMFCLLRALWRPCQTIVKIPLAIPQLTLRNILVTTNIYIVSGVTRPCNSIFGENYLFT